MKKMMVAIFFFYSGLTAGCTYYDDNAQYNFHDDQLRSNPAGETDSGWLMRVRNPQGSGSERNGNRVSIAGNARFVVADDMADIIDELQEVERATVIVADRKAFIGVVLREEFRNRLTEPVENKITNQVTRMNESIRNVYISADPEFVRELNIIANRINRRVPADRYKNRFYRLISSQFPGTIQ